MRVNFQPSEVMGNNFEDARRWGLYRNLGKRCVDLLISAAALMVLALPMLIIAALIKATSEGPALFCQLRAGRGGKMFVVFKFRTMYTSTPQRANHDISAEAMASYVTGIGRVLRKTSLDELPQLINVLMGQMSLIGPRPLAKTDTYVLNLRAEAGADRVKPGLSGLAQVNGRNALSDDLKAWFDADYARDYGLRMDLSIILRSVVVVLCQSGIDQH